VAGIDLDLAFSADPQPQPALRAAAGVWLDPLAGFEPWHALLSAWLDDLAYELAPGLRSPAYSLGLSLVDDEAISALNNDWRNQPGPTDVLAFAARDEGPGQTPPMPLPDSARPEPLELGDIVISVETASRQAAEHGNDLQEELRFLASHGLLHLLGWDHPDPASLAAMLARQEALLAGCAGGRPERR
jgi:probable rRNA maturation factor